PPGEEVRVEVEEVVEVPVRHDHRVDVERVDVLLELRQRPRPGVEPHVEFGLGEQIPAGGPARARPRPVRTEDGDPHRPLPASSIPRAPASGRRKRVTSSANRDGSPLDSNRCSGRRPSPRSRPPSVRTSYTALAVSSADESSSTPSPMTCW